MRAVMTWLVVMGIAAGCGGGSTSGTSGSLCAEETAALAAEMEPQPLGNGLSAALYPSHARYRPNAYVEANLDLFAADGSPELGRVLEVMMVNPTAGASSAPVRLGLAEDVDRPWHYSVGAQVDATWPLVTFLVDISERPLVMDPGVIALSQVIVDHMAPAEVDYAGQLSMTSGVALVARVSADQAVTTTVQLDLQRTDGTSVGSVFATARLPAGGGTVPVPVPGGEATTLALSGGLVVSRAALAVGGACSDVTLVAVPVRP